MPIDYVTEISLGLSRMTVSGRVIFADLESLVRRQLNDPDYALCSRELVDARDVTPDVTSDELRRYAELIARHNGSLPKTRTAIVTNDDLTFGLARMYSGMVESTGREVEVFRTIADAERWLEVGAASTKSLDA
ncbi:MAG: hypothetical protein GC159_05875 [Phycisphaera sp.]|nr:hypothetical protein [Phycisphaera sp.]